jgi:hypothetical protein
MREHAQPMTAGPAPAQYVRMSTEHQQYSTENQMDTMRRFAEARRMEIVRTYSDAARSGLNLEGRGGCANCYATSRAGVLTLPIFWFTTSVAGVAFRTWTRAPTTNISANARIIPAWKVHYEKLVDELGKLVRRVEELTKKGIAPKIASTLVARCSNSPLFVPTVDVATKKVSFNVKRVGRLRQSRAAALLSRYANFMARQAFDHDFGDDEQRLRPEDLVEPISTAGTRSAQQVANAPRVLETPAATIVESANASLPEHEAKASTRNPEPK